MRDFLETFWPLLITFGLIIIVGFAIVGDNDARVRHAARWDSFRTNCSEAGGHMYQVDNEGWCVSDDGRFVEVYP